MLYFRWAGVSRITKITFPCVKHTITNFWQYVSNTNVYSRKCTFPNYSKLSYIQLTYISQLLAVYIQYQCIFLKCTFLNLQLAYIPHIQIHIFQIEIYIFQIQIYIFLNRRAHGHPPTDTYPPIVGRIYPIPVYIQTAYIQTIIFLLGGFSYTTFTFTVSCLGWMWFRITPNLPSLQCKISGIPFNFKDFLRLYLCDYGMWWWCLGSEYQNLRIFNP